MANPKTQTPTAKPAKSNLIAIEKDGETIKVSPLTLNNHLALGWKVAAGKASTKAEPVDDAPDGSEGAPDGENL